MAEQETGTNWVVVGAGALFLALAVLAFEHPILRAIVAIVVFIGTFFMARSREETLIENPLLDQLRTQKQGLDRRKYGRLRSTTERLLENVRQMNRIAIDGREGRLSPRHASAELDRLSALMRDVIDDIRKAAGVPTPTEEHSARPGKVVQPHVVLPKAQRDEQEEEKVAVATDAAEDTEPEESDETDRMLDELEAQAEEAARVATDSEEEEEEEEEEESDKN
jgi:hypothetical protein